MYIVCAGQGGVGTRLTTLGTARKFQPRQFLPAKTFNPQKLCYLRPRPRLLIDFNHFETPSNLGAVNSIGTPCKPIVEVLSFLILAMGSRHQSI